MTATRPAFRVFHLEALESRWCPSTTSVRLQGATLKITGDNNHNEVSVVQDDQSDTLEVVADGHSYQFASSDVRKVVVDLKGGDDTFSWQMDSTEFSYTKCISLALGNGNDTAELDWSETTLSAALNVTVDASNGNDDVRARFGEVDSSGCVQFKACLGNGSDACAVTQEGDLNGRAKVKIGINGDAGNDMLSVLADHVFVDYSALLDVSIDGGAGNDMIDFTYAGELHGQVKLNARGGSGNDMIKAELTLDSSSDGKVCDQVYGDSGCDDLTLHVYDSSHSSSGYHGQARIDARIDGGRDSDRYDITPGIKVVGCERKR